MSRARDLADRVLHNRTHEDIEGGRESILTFKGEQSGGEISTLAQIQASHDGTSDDEKADLIFKTNDGSDGASPTEALRITSQQRVGIGDVDPIAPLHISSGDSGASASVHSDELFVEGSGNSGITIGSGTSGYGNVRFADSGGTDQGIVQYYHGDDRLMIFTNGTKRLSIDSDGVKFGTDTAADNALYDYEEGAWTPNLGGFTIASGALTGKYRKIGGLVSLTMWLENATLSGSGSATITGLPFQCAARTSSSMPVVYNHQYGDKPLGILIENGTSNAYLQYNTTGAWIGAAFSAGANRYMSVQMTYVTDS